MKPSALSHENHRRAGDNFSSTLTAALFVSGLIVLAVLFVGTSRLRYLISRTIDPRVNVPWTLKITSAGGITGRGNGNVLVDSRGNVTAERPTSIPRPPCVTRLSDEELKTIKQAVSSTVPILWKQNQVNSERPGGWADELGYGVELSHRPVSGVTFSYSSSWADSTMHLIPEDLAELYKAATTVGTDVLGKCESTRR